MTWRCKLCGKIQSDKTEPAETRQDLSFKDFSMGKEYYHCRPCVDAAKSRQEARRKERASRRQEKLNA